MTNTEQLTRLIVTVKSDGSGTEVYESRHEAIVKPTTLVVKIEKRSPARHIKKSEIGVISTDENMGRVWCRPEERNEKYNQIINAIKRNIKAKIERLEKLAQSIESPNSKTEIVEFGIEGREDI